MRRLLLATVAAITPLVVAGGAQAKFCASPIHPPCCPSPCPVGDWQATTRAMATAGYEEIIASTGNHLGNYTGITRLYQGINATLGSEGLFSGPFTMSSAMGDLQRLGQLASSAAQTYSRIASLGTNPSQLLGAAGSFSMGSSSPMVSSLGLAAPYARSLGFGSDPYSMAYGNAMKSPATEMAYSAYGGMAGPESMGLVTGVAGYSGSALQASQSLLAGNPSALGGWLSPSQGGFGGFNGFVMQLLMNSSGFGAYGSQMLSMASSGGASSMLTQLGSTAGSLQNINIGSYMALGQQLGSLSSGGSFMSFAGRAMPAGSSAISAFGPVLGAFGANEWSREIYTWHNSSQQLFSYGGMAAGIPAQIASSPVSAAMNVSSRLYGALSSNSGEGVTARIGQRATELRHTAVESYGYAQSHDQNRQASIAAAAAIAQAAREAQNTRQAMRVNTEAKLLVERELATTLNLIAARTQVRASRSMRQDPVTTDTAALRDPIAGAVQFALGEYLLTVDSQGLTQGQGWRGMRTVTPDDGLSSHARALAEARASVSALESVADRAHALHDDLAALNYAERERPTLLSMIGWYERAVAAEREVTQAADALTQTLGGQDIPNGWQAPRFSDIKAVLRGRDPTSNYDVAPVPPNNFTDKDQRAINAATQTVAEILAQVPTQIWYQPCGDTSVCGLRDYGSTNSALTTAYVQTLEAMKMVQQMETIAVEAREAIGRLDMLHQGFKARWGIEPSAAPETLRQTISAAVLPPANLPSQDLATRRDLAVRRLSQALGDLQGTALIPPPGTDAEFTSLPMVADRSAIESMERWVGAQSRALEQWQALQNSEQNQGAAAPPTEPNLQPPPPGLLTP